MAVKQKLLILVRRHVGIRQLRPRFVGRCPPPTFQQFTNLLSPVTRARDRQRRSSLRYISHVLCPRYFARASLKLASGHARSVVVLFLVDLYIYRTAVRVQDMRV